MDARVDARVDAQVDARVDARIDAATRRRIASGVRRYLRAADLETCTPRDLLAALVRDDVMRNGCSSSRRHARHVMRCALRAIPLPPRVQVRLRVVEKKEGKDEGEDEGGASYCVAARVAATPARP
jgi:hypothetical protein